MSLVHINLNHNIDLKPPDSFITLLKSLNGWTLALRLPLVYKVDNFYDIYQDNYHQDVWCTPIVIFRKYLSICRFEFEFIGKYEIAEKIT